MTSLLSDRRHVVRVGNPDGPVATGVVIAPDLVLTARHVIPRETVEVLFGGATQWVDAEVVWESLMLDMMLLRAHGSGWHPGIAWAIAQLGGEVTVLGFPERDQSSDPFQPMAEIRAVVVQESVPMRCELVSKGLAAGMSGGPIVGPHGELVGVAIGQSDCRLLATSVRSLLENRAFRAEARLVNEPPVVIPGRGLRGARGLLSPPPVGWLSRGSLPGWPRTEVPFAGRENEVSELVIWCESPEKSAVAEIIGAGGSGKTRLATELCRIVESQGWMVGFVERGQPLWGAAVITDAPTLFVIDYADTWPSLDLHRLLSLESTGPHPLRFLVVARSGFPISHSPQTVISLDQQLSDRDKARLGEAAVSAAGIDRATVGELAHVLKSARTPFDIIFAISVLTDQNVMLERSDPPPDLLAFAVRSWLTRWGGPQESQGTPLPHVVRVIALVLLVRPAAKDLPALLHQYLELDGVGGDSLLSGAFGTADGLVPDLPDTVLAQILEGTESPDKVMRNAVDWSVGKPEYATRVLSVLTGIALDGVELRRHMVALMNERIEALAESATAAGVSGFQSALIALIDKVRPVTDGKTIREWRAAIRRARGVERIRFGGLADRRAREDQLDRKALISALVDMARPPRQDEGHEDATGPSVIAVDGPWGAGKTSVMGLVKDQLDDMARKNTVDEPSRWRRRFTVAEAMWSLRRWGEEPEREPVSRTDSRRSMVTVWFNPWAHQSSEQVWAGLARTILVAVNARLHRSEPERARYWLRRNASRLDRGQLSRHLFHAVRSPMFKVAFFALFVPIIAALLRFEASFQLFGATVPATGAAAWLVGGMVVLALVHTLLRLLFGRAVAYCPPGVLDGPVLSGVLAQPGGDQAVRDPLYHARSGYLYLLQHDIRRLLVDAADEGLEVVVFIDDLDRCSPKTTAEVLEAVNLFLSEEFPATRFVIGLDMGVVADQIDSALGANSVRRYFDDPSAGWTFLRKLIQLPLVLPRIPAATLDNLVGGFLGPVEQDDELQDAPPPPVTTPERPPPPVTEARPPVTASPTPRPARTSDVPPVPAPSVEATDRRVSRLEANVEVRQRITERLHALPVPSARETKRLLTIWQFYVRVLTYQDSSVSGAAEIRRARATVLVAEIVARWPAQLPQLLSTEDGTRGLRRLLAAAREDDVIWIHTATRIGLDHAKEKTACRALRDILRSADGPEAVALVEHLF